MTVIQFVKELHGLQIMRAALHQISINLGGSPEQIQRLRQPASIARLLKNVQRLLVMV